ncbi:hypothetical protein ABZT03_11650 [Streptomyces sp. NPDC005574]|uniref:hypothetical protein n=1 Tax=Streptomyces sp. NPDC005574 TaxID=3156891 RepID=UPI0033B53C29
MGSMKVALCAGFLAAVAVAPAAYAQDGGVSVSPASPAPGGDIAMRVTGCAQKTGIAVSAAFVADIRLTDTDGMLVGESRIRSTVTAGTYDVKIRCGGAEHKARITVGHGQDQGRDQRRDQGEEPAIVEPPVPSAPSEPSAPSSPVAPVHAGGGGTAPRVTAAHARSAGVGTGHAVTGLVLAGVAAVAVALRSVRRSRGTG